MQKNVSKKNIQYPAPTGPYKVFVKDSLNLQDYSVARLQISVGNPRHEGEKFFALTEWAAARFDKVVLIISDTLQRYNIAVQNNVSMAEAHKLSLLNGKKWMQFNEKAIESIPSNIRILSFWDDWLSHPEYAQSYTDMKRLFLGNMQFQKAVEEKAALYCHRNTEKNTPDLQDNLKISVDYILEELAIFSIMFREEDAVDIYPGTWFRDIFTVINDSQTSSNFSGFSTVKCVGIDFTKNKAYKSE